MRDYPQILNKIRSTPWLITEDGLRVILEIVDARVNGQRLSEEDIKQRLVGTERASSPNGISASEGVGILPIHGPIFGKANMMTEMSGATSIEKMQQDFRGLMQNDLVSSILLDIDSPGGVSDLVMEMGEEIRDARETKPIYAIANTMAGSAAYWLASQATQLLVTPSGSVGSIGVYAVHTDESHKNRMEGIDTTIIKAGRFKAELMEPLTAEAKGHVQKMVDETYEGFIEAVAAGRKTTTENVRSNYGEGRMLSAKEALKLGMVDGVATFDSVLENVLLSSRPKSYHSSNSLGNISATGNILVSDSTSFSVSYDKEKEHSEPGTGMGSEPLPRVPPEDEDVDTWDKGERLHRPPNIPELEAMVMNREELLAYAERLGIDDADALSNEELNTRVTAGLTTALDTVHELTAATSQAQQNVEFAQQFPEQAEQLRRLQERDQTHEASAFANSLADFKIEAEGGKSSSFRLSTLAQGIVKEAHLKLSQRNFLHDDLAEVIKVVATGTVEQGERGSSRSSEHEDSAPTDRFTARTEFANRVKELMESDNLDRKTAIAEAGKRYPQLADAYLRS